MRDVQMQKSQLIERVRANMEAHTEKYEAALERFKERQIEILEEALTKAKAGKKFDRHVMGKIPVPEEHSDDYRVALEMLELEERDVLLLGQHEFRQYYLDEWDWQRSFAANTGSYLAAMED